MASTTTNIGLTKPAGTDQALISAINGNMDIIDTKMGAVGNTSVQSQITSLSDQIATIGGSNKSWISNAELNDFKTTGHYYIGSGAKVGGTAVTAYNWSVLVVDGGRTDTLAQTLFTNGNKLERQFRDNAWTSFVSISDQISKKLNCVEKTTGSGNTFTITFDGYGAGHNAYIFGRFGYDSTKLSSAIVSHEASGSASIKCFGDETATVSCSGDVVTVTTQNSYAAVTVISSKKIT